MEDDTQAEVKVTLRMPESMHAAIKRLAERQMRSMHNQMLFMIRDSLERAEQEQEGVSST
jgi:hypothetical protein